MRGEFLNQLKQRATTESSPVERHQAAFYMWEFGLRCLGCVSVVCYRDAGIVDETVNNELRFLARPALGHWWSITQRLIAQLSDNGDRDFQKIQEKLTKDNDAALDVIKLDGFLQRELGKISDRMSVSSVRLKSVFDRMIQYRNREFHGYLGGRLPSFYEEAWSALLPGVEEIWSLVDVYAGRLPIYLEEARLLPSGRIRLSTWDLSTETRRSLPHIDVAKADSLSATRMYLSYQGNTEASSETSSWTLLYPFAIYDFDENELQLYGSVSRTSGVAYVGCKSGKHCRETQVDDRRKILRDILGPNVTSEDVRLWSCDSQASDAGLIEFPRQSVRQTLGEFELIARIGSGSYGTVYKAWQPATRRFVAVKRLTNSGNKQRQIRFSREIEALGRVDHPHLIKIFQSGTDGEDIFYAMELIEGVDLGTLLQHHSSTDPSSIDSAQWQESVSSVCELAKANEEPLQDSSADDPTEVRRHRHIRRSVVSKTTGQGHVKHVVEIVHDVADALQALHDAKVIHRDVKPSNIMITDAGEAILMDLGLARIVDSQSITQTADHVGTVRYMSPEQLFRSKKIDARSDIYNLGATFWELLTLRPFLAITADVSVDEQYRRVRRSDADSVRKHNKHVPPDLARVVSKCVEKDEDRRYRNMSELIDDLVRWTKGEPVIAQDPSVRYLLTKIVTRHKKTFAAICLGAIATIVLVVVSFVAIETARRDAVDAAEALEQQLYDTHISVAEREITSNHDFDLAAQLLDDCPERFRGWEWDYLHRRLDGPSKTLRGHERGLWTAEFSPDGQQAVTASIDGTVKIWDVESGEVLHDIKAQPAIDAPAGLSIPIPMISGLLEDVGLQGTPIMCATYSPDGKQIASGSFAPKISGPIPKLDLNASPGVVTLWDSERGTKVKEYREHFGVVMSIAYSPDGRHVASSTINSENTFNVWDRLTGATVAKLRGHQSTVHRIRFDKTGTRMLSGDTFGMVNIWDTDDYELVRSIQAHRAPIIDIAMNPTSSEFATASEDGSVVIWSLANGQKIRALSGHLGSALGVSYSPDGRLIASGGFDNTVRVWDAYTGAPRITLRGHLDVVWSVVFGPEGKKILSASYDNTARIWSSTSTGPRNARLQFVGHKDRPNTVVASPDGKVIATASWDQTVIVWDAEQGKVVRVLEGFESAVWGLAFHPQKTILAAASWDGTVRIWDYTSGKSIAVLEDHSSAVHCVAFDRSGLKLATGGWDGQVKIWDTEDWQMLTNCDGFVFPVFTVAFIDQGRKLVSGGTDRKISVWDTTTGKRLGEIGRHGAVVHDLAVNQDQTLLYSASWDRTIKTWKLDNLSFGILASRDPLRHLVKTFSGHSDRVNDISLSSDDRFLATASDDKTVRIWDTKTGQVVGNPFYHRGAVWSVDFGPDGKSVASACWSTRVGVQKWTIPWDQ